MTWKLKSKNWNNREFVKTYVNSNARTYSTLQKQINEQKILIGHYENQFRRTATLNVNTSIKISSTN